MKYQESTSSSISEHMEDGKESYNLIFFGQRRISAMPFHSALPVDKYTGRKTPFSAFFLLYRAYSTANSCISEEWSPFFSSREQKLNSQEIESLNNCE